MERRRSGRGGWGGDFDISFLYGLLARGATSRSAKHGMRVNNELSSDRADFPVFGIEPVTNLSLRFSMEHPAPHSSALRTNESPSSAANDAAKPTGEPCRVDLRPAKGDRQGHAAAEWGRKGRLICHAGSQAPAIVTLAGAMILMPFDTETLFIPAIGFVALQATGFFSAAAAAVTLTAVTVATDPEQLAAGEANMRT